MWKADKTIQVPIRVFHLYVPKNEDMKILPLSSENLVW